MKYWWLVLGVLILFGCQASEPTYKNQISFVSVRKSTNLGYVESFSDPSIITTTLALDDTAFDPFRGFFLDTDYTSIVPINYAQEVAIGVFRGTQPTSGYDVVVHAVGYNQAVLTVFIELQTPQEGKLQTAALTQPYEIITIQLDVIKNEHEITLKVVDYKTKQEYVRRLVATK